MYRDEEEQFDIQQQREEWEYENLNSLLKENLLVELDDDIEKKAVSIIRERGMKYLLTHLMISEEEIDGVLTELLDEILEAREEQEED